MGGLFKLCKVHTTSASGELNTLRNQSFTAGLEMLKSQSIQFILPHNPCSMQDSYRI